MLISFARGQLLTVLICTGRTFCESNRNCVQILDFRQNCSYQNETLRHTLLTDCARLFKDYIGVLSRTNGL